MKVGDESRARGSLSRLERIPQGLSFANDSAELKTAAVLQHLEQMPAIPLETLKLISA